MGDAAGNRPPWTFLTSHARVLLAISRDPGVRLREVAGICTLTERTVQSIVADLEEAGYLRRVRDGRRNHYEIVLGAKFRHPAEAGHDIAGLLALLAEGPLTPSADGAPADWMSREPAQRRPVHIRLGGRESKGSGGSRHG
ncbi:helix-turn-helix transcriptional regulator [Streptomyces sp. NPDC058646]|uniref:helix-turn-helix transcriptional regulator n=1 Tax=Streptomyces sp. NPDC058646 TaxID=3346574 RepID=UPI00364C18AE